MAKEVIALYYNFTNLINKYSRKFKLCVNSGGSYNQKGDYVQGTATVTEYFGAIVGLTRRYIQASDGNYTNQDKMLYSVTKLPKGTVIFDDKEYEIAEEHTESNGVFTGVYIYLLRYNQDKAVTNND